MLDGIRGECEQMYYYTNDKQQEMLAKAAPSLLPVPSTEDCVKGLESGLEKLWESLDELDFLIVCFRKEVAS